VLPEAGTRARHLFLDALSLKPAHPSRFGDIVWIAFVIAEVLDGGLTSVGISRLGTDIEANPLLAWTVAVAGVTLALVVAKGFALACGAVLHLRSMHRWVSALTLLHIVGAILPWCQVVWPLV
jgi:hypothetical protein